MSLQDINLKFTSANSVPVDRAIVTKMEWLSAITEIKKLRRHADNLESMLLEAQKRAADSADEAYKWRMIAESR